MDEEAISIYFGLEQGARADLEVIARALLELSHAIKAFGEVVDPGMDIRVEVVRGRDGSLFVDLIIKAVKYLNPGKKGAIEITGLVFLALLTDTRQFFDSKLLDRLFVGGDKATVEDPASRSGKVEEAKKAIEQITKNNTGGTYIQNFYGTLLQDNSITGVGASRGSGTKPDVIVRRPDFAQRAKPVQRIHVDEVRVIKEEMTVTLISPILIPGQRKWRLKSDKGEFSAAIIDNDFQKKFQAGQTQIRLQSGIEMRVVVSVLENKIDGAWHISSREIIEVKSIKAAPHQGSLDFGD